MKNSNNTISVAQARRILGTEFKDIDDLAVQKMIEQIEAITDLVVLYMIDSKIKPAIDIEKESVHTSSK